jgi:hypothetical protein
MGLPSKTFFVPIAPLASFPQWKRGINRPEWRRDLFRICLAAVRYKRNNTENETKDTPGRDF